MTATADPASASAIVESAPAKEPTPTVIPKEAAALHRRVLACRDAANRAAWEFGAARFAMRDAEGYRAYGHATFRAYLESDDVRVSYRTAKRFEGIYRKFASVGKIASGVSYSKLDILSRLVQPGDDPELVAARVVEADQMPVRELETVVPVAVAAGRDDPDGRLLRSLRSFGLLPATDSPRFGRSDREPRRAPRSGPPPAWATGPTDHDRPRGLRAQRLAERTQAAADARRRDDKSARRDDAELWAAGHAATVLGAGGFDGGLLTELRYAEHAAPWMRPQRTTTDFAALLRVAPEDVARALVELDATADATESAYGGAWTAIHPDALTTVPKTLRWLADVLDAYATLTAVADAANAAAAND